MEEGLFAVPWPFNLLVPDGREEEPSKGHEVGRGKNMNNINRIRNVSATDNICSNNSPRRGPRRPRSGSSSSSGSSAAEGGEDGRDREARSPKAVNIPRSSSSRCQQNLNNNDMNSLTRQVVGADPSSGHAGGGKGTLRRQTVSCEGDFPRSLTSELREAFYATVLSGSKTQERSSLGTANADDTNDGTTFVPTVVPTTPPRSMYAGGNTSYYYDANNNMRRRDRDASSPGTVVIGSGAGGGAGIGAVRSDSSMGTGVSRVSMLKASLGRIPSTWGENVGSSIGVSTGMGGSMSLCRPPGRRHSCDPLPSKGVALTISPLVPVRLPAEETTVDSTPLSSLRSCSEFTKFSISKFDSRYSRGHTPVVGQKLPGVEGTPLTDGSGSVVGNKKKRGIKRWISSTLGLDWYSHENVVSALAVDLVPAADNGVDGVGAPSDSSSGVTETLLPLPRTASSGSRRVTFRESDSFDEQSELSFLVETLSRPTSRSVSQSTRTLSTVSENRSRALSVVSKHSLLSTPTHTPSSKPAEDSRISPVHVQYLEANDIDAKDVASGLQVASLLSIGSTETVDYKLNSPHRSSLLLLEAESRRESVAVLDILFGVGNLFGASGGTAAARGKAGGIGSSKTKAVTKGSKDSVSSPVEMELQNLDLSGYGKGRGVNKMAKYQAVGRQSRYRSRTHFSTSRTFYSNYYNNGNGLFTGTSSNYTHFHRTLTQDSNTTGGASSTESLYNYFQDGFTRGTSGSDWTTGGMFSTRHSFASRNSSNSNLNGEVWLDGSNPSMQPDEDGLFSFNYGNYIDDSDDEDVSLWGRVPPRTISAAAGNLFGGSSNSGESSSPIEGLTIPSSGISSTTSSHGTASTVVGAGPRQEQQSPSPISSPSRKGSPSVAPQIPPVIVNNNTEVKQRSPGAWVSLVSFMFQLLETLRRLPKFIYRYVARPGMYYLGYTVSFCVFHTVYCFLNPYWWRKIICGGAKYVVSSCARLSRTLLFDSEGSDADFYELIRLQPFATGGYLRGMLVSGFASLGFCVYSMLLWPDLSEVVGTEIAADGLPFFSFSSWNWYTMMTLLSRAVPHDAKTCLYAWLVLQTVLNSVQMLPRVLLHLSCWEASRAIEVSDALVVLRTIIVSDMWAVNRLFGRITDVLVLIALATSEFYLWFLSPVGDPLRPLILSMASTNMLAFIIRGVISVVFALSNHDPQVLAEARRRGLTKWDIDILPTVVFTDMREVSSHECSICLCDFDLGELVTSLPCDGKHSYHESCIRKWLERQNSCPLCQKMV